MSLHGWIFIFIMIGSVWLPAADLSCWEFPSALREWSVLRRLKPVAGSDSVFLDLQERDSGLGITGLSLEADEIGGFAVEYRAMDFQESTTGQLYYATVEEPMFTAERMLNVGSLVADGEWHTIKIMAGGGAWASAGTVTSLRLDLVDQYPGKIWLRSIRVLPTELSRAEARGIPVRVPVELGTREQQWTTTMYDPRAPRFASPMAAPAAGGFEFVGECFLRKEFVLSHAPEKALLLTSADDQVIEASLNGRRLEVSWSGVWRHSNRVEIDAEMLRGGRNVLCIHYRNHGGLGGVMADLQMVDQEGNFQTFTLADAKGFFGGQPPANWQQLTSVCDWATVETRPGAPTPPWRFTPEYDSIDPHQPQAEVHLLERTETECTAEFKCSPQYSGDELFYVRLTDVYGALVGYQSGTAEELGAEKTGPDTYLVHFDLSNVGLRYGGPVRIQWTVGIYGRRVSGQSAFWQELGERPLPGEAVSLQVEQTPAGPRPLLNGRPFYIVSLNVEHLDVPTGMEGKGSPCNVITTRAGGWLPQDWWIGPDTYDFSIVDRQLSFCADKYPDAWLGLYVWCHPNRWYADMFPERLAMQDDGEVVNKNLATGAPVAFSNEDYRRDAERAVRALVAHCEKYFGSRIVLYNLQGGITYEWQGWNSHTKFFSDYAEQSAQDFRRYAQTHGLEVSGVPTRAEREAGLPGGLFRDPVRDAVSVLYERFYSESIAECIDRLAKVVREETHGNKLVGAYYGYHQEFSSLGYCVNGGGHNDLHRLLESPNLDFFLSPIDYRHRSIGAPSSDMKPYGAIREAGKLAISEDDTRTNRIAPTGFDQTVNMEQTLAVLKRNQGVALTRGMVLNHLPLIGGCELDAPEVRELFGRTAKAGQMMVEEPVTPKAEIAVVLDEEALAILVPTLRQIYVPDTSRYHYAPATGDLVEVSRGVQPLTTELLGDQQLALSQCGASVDWLMLQEPSSLAGYKLVIFCGAFQDSPQLREALAVIRAGDATALFVYGNGFMTSHGVDVARMSELLGIKLVEVRGGSLQMRLMDGQLSGMDYFVQPRFAVADGEATVLGHYLADGTVAAARKGKAIFYGGAALTSQFVREIAREAGVHIYTETDDNFFAGGNFLCIHSDSTGTKTICLPYPTDAVEIYTYEVLGRQTDRLEFPMKALETKVILLGDAKRILAKLAK